ncbi:MAG: hypothetical protein N2117_15745 [Anaerolineales bacterium]|nr:hypothetical protein [Anaerolineales bacterium]MCX7756680.1 hypothetical protein [Anaerolineales bacterium]MDW8279259.1 hypothetical protein [Anaerolineales bacterium]
MMNRTPIQLFPAIRRFSQQRGAAFALILSGALLAFEIFNYSTTDYALTDLLGNLKFMGIRWATLLSIAFCGIDFAGIARLFTPEQGREEPAEVWYLFGAWILAAAMNATLTWWGVSLALASHTPASAAIMERSTLTNIVPIFVAVMVWVIRILLIGTFALAGERLFTMEETHRTTRPAAPGRPLQSARPNTLTARPTRPQPYSSANAGAARPEPTYHPATFSAKPKDSNPRY